MFIAVIDFFHAFWALFGFFKMEVGASTAGSTESECLDSSESSECLEASGVGPKILSIICSIEEVTDDADMEETFCATSTDWALLDSEGGGVTSGSGSL